MATTRGFLYRARFEKLELERMLEKARAQLVENGPESIMSWGDNGTNVTKRPELTVAEWVDEIVYSLALTDPDTYADRTSADVTTAAFPRRFS